ncbi:hypothetical protein SPRG_09421 [Saprolegnia parasitica CBS 223.65]|uniref:Nucleoside transporter n=1 Tax=Saprolegnia parasitica (strain CBS 223.65) TaxID=695850 RepID=A0A067C4L9_SAPPC|nr:hypothetical protein SPRG_09421 [Saprolegnia parasitica CBS 223.65]KDO25478.1 hypothetical protein SPRG_09421 [Saprolegnia parasitica CBS 223.65]|eukprot:XP_012203903.1 hypothetical protein SPRG_09421 [Saprolegnia parasitica CBS 223.65]
MTRAPADRCHAGYLVLFLMGVAALLPWNVFITADGYFGQRLAGTPVATSFLTYFSMAFNLTALGVLTLNTVCFRSYLPRPSVKITVALVGIALVVFLSTVLVKTPSIQGMVFFNMTMTSIVVASICAAYLQEGLFELTATFPERYTQAIMTGQSLAGFLVALSAFCIAYLHLNPTTLQMRWYVGDDATDSAFSYFLTAFVTIALAMLAFAAFLKSPLARFYMAPPSNDVIASLESLLEDAPKGKVTLNPAKVLWRVRSYAMSVVLAFFLSLAVFPVLTSAVVSSSSNKTFRSLFTPLTFVLFNAGDLVGRIVAGVAPHLLLGRGLVVLSLLRIGFLPLLGLCRLQAATTTRVVLDHDAYPLVLIFLCAFSNGLVVSLAMMQSAHSVAPHQRALTGALMFFASRLASRSAP